MAKKQDNRDLLRAIFFDNVQEGFIILDKDMNLIDANESFFNLLPMSKAQVLGKHVSEISPGIMETERYALYQQVIRTGKPVVIDQVTPHPSSGNLFLRIYAFKVGEGLGIAVSDITDLTEAIEELNTFTYKASHDIRRPIATILGLISVAEMDSDNLETAFYYCDLIKQQAKRMDIIQRGLIELTRIREGNMTLKLINFDRLIDKALKSLTGTEGYQVMHFEKNIATKQKFYSDESLLVSLFQNLIDNAIRYRKEYIENPYVKIVIADYNNGVKITIADNGMGIHDKDQNKVFKMFYRAHYKASGTGLGLYTVKHCVKQLSGQIKLESKIEEGTTFTIWLPSEAKKKPLPAVVIS